MNMIQFKCQIFPEPIPDHISLNTYLSEHPQIQSKELLKTQKPAILTLPLVPIIIEYHNPTYQPIKINFQSQIWLNNQKLHYSIQKQREEEGILYKLLYIQSCECFSHLLTLDVVVKHGSESEKNLSNFQDISSALRNKQLQVFSPEQFKIRKSLIVIEQLGSYYKYSSSEGYLLMKLDNCERTQKNVTIKSVQLMNWFCIQNKQFSMKVINSTFEETELAPEECYVIVFEIPKNLRKLQVPYNVVYRVGEWEFKMIKYMRI